MESMVLNPTWRNDNHSSKMDESVSVVSNLNQNVLVAFEHIDLFRVARGIPRDDDSRDGSWR